jgi:hypothetical protein
MSSNQYDERKGAGMLGITSIHWTGQATSQARHQTQSSGYATTGLLSASFHRITSEKQAFMHVLQPLQASMSISIFFTQFLGSFITYPLFNVNYLGTFFLYFQGTLAIN